MGKYLLDNSATPYAWKALLSPGMDLANGYGARRPEIRNETDQLRQRVAELEARLLEQERIIATHKRVRKSSHAAPRSHR